MAASPPARFQVGIALNADLMASLAEAESFAFAQAQLVAIACVLRDADWHGVLVILRLADGAVLDRLVVAAALDA